MTWWNHRIVRRKHDDGSLVYAIHEMFYGEEGGRSITTDAIHPAHWTDDDLSENPKADDVAMRAGLLKDFRRQMRAFCRPTVDYDTREDLPFSGPKRGIYVASKISHAPKWRAMRDAGVPINSTWIDRDDPLDPDELSDLWVHCIREVQCADAVVAYRANIDEHLKGALSEIGAALALGIPVFAVGLTGLTIHRHPGITNLDSLDEAFNAARIVASTPKDTQWV